MASQNGIIGDDFGIDIPQTEVQNNALVDEKKAARYSKSKEYLKLKEHFESRIQFYQNYLPDGRPLMQASKTEREEMWLVANIIIAELTNVMNYYETAKEAVGEA